MCILTKIQKIQQQKADLDAQIAKLEQLQSRIAPAKSLLTDLLKVYAEEVPEDLPDIWKEILTIGQKFNLAVQPIAADELRQWETAQAENEKLKQELERTKDQYLELLEISANRVKELQAEFELQLLEREDACNTIETELEEVRSQLPENYRQEVPMPHANPNATGEEQVLTGEKYDAAVEEELALDDDDSDTIPALSLWQPWASLIAKGIKCVETRSWSTNYRGPIAIHATKKPVYTGIPELLDLLLLKTDCEPPLGAVVAIADLVDVKEMTPKLIAEQSEQEILCGDWQPGRFAWILENVRPIDPPVPAKGGQKLWQWDGMASAAGSKFGEVEEQKINWEDWNSKFKSSDKQWDVGVKNEKDGGLMLLFQGKHESFTETVTQEEWEKKKAAHKVWTKRGVLGDYAEEILRRRVKVADDLSAQKLTELEKLLVGNSNFTFEELGVSVAVESVIAPADDTVDFESEEARITVTDAKQTREYYIDAQTFVYQHKDVQQVALAYANYFLNELEKDFQVKEKIARWKADPATEYAIEVVPIAETTDQEPAEGETETRFEAMGYSVQVYPQYAGENLVGATFRFLNEEATVIFAKSLLKTDIGDRTWKTCAYDLIQDYRDKEAARLEKIANPHKKPEDDFIELIKLTPAVGYLKQKVGVDAGKILATYIAFANRDSKGDRTLTNAKPRAQKWRDHYHASFQTLGWEVGEVRKVKRMVGEPGKSGPSYEIKILGASIEQIQKLAEQDFSLLPNEIAPQPTKLPIDQAFLKLL